jgi:hypothetical protein
MRRRAMLVVVPILCCVAAALLAAPASAAPCPPEVSAALALHAPERAAYERGFSAHISRPFTEERVDVEGLRISFQPASKGGKLASAFTASPDPPKAEFEGFETRTLWFASGDGPGLLTARWTQGDHETGVVCEESQSIEIRPIRGRLSPVHAELRWEKGSHEFTLEMPCAAGKKEEFEMVSPAPVLVTIKGADGRKIARVPDVCLESRFKAFETRNWAIYRTLVGDNVGIQVSSFGVRRPALMRFEVRQAGQLTAQGRFRIWDQSRPSRRIYEGSDAFVNYCIDETREIRSSHGRLYCVYPGYYRTLASDLHWSALEASKE